MEIIDEKILKNRWFILFNVVMMTFMACLDSSIVNVALPVMAKKLQVGMGAIEWVVTSYLIAICALILIFGRIGDVIGKVKVFKFGVVVFTLGSLVCGMAGSLPLLVFARGLQAIGAAGTMATSQGIITQSFPSTERGRALGLSGTFVALGTMIGPPLGGFIISVFNWNIIFLINVPIGIFTILMAMKILPKGKNLKKVESLEKNNIDWQGGLLLIVSVVLLFGSLMQGQNTGYNSVWIIGGFVIALLAFVAFIITENKAVSPLLQLSIFENKLFSLSLFCGFISFIAISSSNIIQPFYLQDVMKLTPATTGLFMMIYPLVLSIVAPISGHLSDKIGSEILTFIGLVFTSGGLVLMATLTEHSTMLSMTGFIILMSMGNGLFQSPNTSLIMSTVERTKLGIAGSINGLIRNLGMVFGISMSTALLYNRMSHKIGHHIISYVEGRSDVFVYGMRYVYLTAAVICAFGACLTAIRLSGSNRKKKLLNISDIEEEIKKPLEI